jgi:hypothetical protein
MASRITKVDARAEVNDAKSRHDALLEEVRDHCVTRNSSKLEIYYLLAIPVVYAAWEGYFKLVCSICIKRQCDSAVKAKDYSQKFAALWLQKEPFFLSFLDKTTAAMQLGRTVKAGGKQFLPLVELSEKLAHWHDNPVDDSVDFASLVMTHSNVNADVAKINAVAIGLDLRGVTFGKLDELLSRRNDIAHGGLLTYPKEHEVIELIDYALRLIDTFNTSAVNWISTT